MRAELAWQSKPQLAAAMVQDLYSARVLPFKYVVADCLYGNSPDFWAACEACVGTVAFVATPADTRCWLQPLATTTQTYTYKKALYQHSCHEVQSSYNVSLDSQG